VKKILVMSLVSLFLLSVGSITYTAEYGTVAEAEAMVKKAIAYLKANGKDKAFAEFSNPKGQFVDRDLYVTVYDLNGKCLAHGANLTMIGKDLIDLKDTDGKAFIKERIELAKTKEKFWHDYKFMNPVSKKIEPKSMYCERVEDIIVACGTYNK
jgi:signal transduction histidine kinase